MHGTMNVKYFKFVCDDFRTRCKVKRPPDTSLCNYHIKLAEHDRFLLTHLSRFCLKMLTGIQVSGDFDFL